MYMEIVISIRTRFGIEYALLLYNMFYMYTFLTDFKYKMGSILTALSV